MKISTAKTEVLHLPRNPDQCVLQVNGATLKQVESFKYLEVAFTSDGRQDEELDNRFRQGSAVMRALHYEVCHETRRNNSINVNGTNHRRSQRDGLGGPGPLPN